MPAPTLRLGKLTRMGTGWRQRLPVSWANPVMLSGTGSRLRYAGSCTFTMRATLSSTILASAVRSSPDPRRSPAELPRLRRERKRPAGACSPDRAGRGCGHAKRGDLPGADWQRAGDVRAPGGFRGGAGGRGDWRVARPASKSRCWRGLLRWAFYVCRRWRSAERILCRRR